jgi:hypothetical protein
MCLRPLLCLFVRMPLRKGASTNAILTLIVVGYMCYASCVYVIGIHQHLLVLMINDKQILIQVYNASMPL